LHFPFKLVEVLKEADLGGAAGSGAGDSGGLVPPPTDSTQRSTSLNFAPGSS
jgi:hypothetical protein